MRILAVDDDDMARALLAEALASAGYKDLILVDSGSQALESIRKMRQFDCILLDIEMPEMDGIELCRRIRRLPEHGETPIVMITAMQHRRFVDAAFMAGATDYVTKPFDTLELSTRLAIAEKLTIQASRLAAKDDEIADLTSARSINISASLATAYGLDVHGIIELGSFENYLRQIGRSRFSRSYLAGFKINGFESRFESCELSDLLYTLSDVASALVAEFHRLNAVFTYAGNGVFLCAFKGRPERIDSKALKSVMRRLDLTGSQLRPSSFSPLSIETKFVIRVSELQQEDPLEFIRGEVGDQGTVNDDFVATSVSREAEPRGLDANSISLTNGMMSLLPTYLAKLRVFHGTLNSVAEKPVSDGLTDDELEIIRTIVHKISGVAPTFGFAELGSSSRKLEELLTSDDGVQSESRLQQQFDGLDVVLEEIESVLLKYRDIKPTGESPTHRPYTQRL